MSKPHVLVVEDNSLTASTLCSYLQRSDFVTSRAGDGPTAWSMINAQSFDLVLLDLMLPGIDGLELCRRIRESSSVPVLMITARSTEDDAITGLSAGADDYIRKPFSPREVVARCQRALLRTETDNESAVVSLADDVLLDQNALRAVVRGEAIKLTRAEARLLTFMAKRPGRVLDRETLLSAVYDDIADVSDRTIDTHLYNLRRKLEIDPKNPRLLTSEYGIGYKLTKTRI
ncbi:MAG: DNA-binding response regulator [Lysobacteraceae bacterium]|nr:MAG: DNA-binding response regulator [Xanthomonadaceae bacterium]